MQEPIYCPGLEGVIAGETSISDIEDGLRYRGYSVEDLADNASFEEVAFLVLQGNLPNHDQLKAFQERLKNAAMLPPKLLESLRLIPDHASMMDVMRTGASLLGAWDEGLDNSDATGDMDRAERLLATLPIVMAFVHRRRSGKEPTEAELRFSDRRSFAANVLWLATGQEPTETATRALDATLTMYAEHEFNASTFAAQVVTSTLSDIYSAVTAAIGALKGPLHGGANERVMDILNEIGSPDRAENWIREALAKKTRIMGFGHRVYKTGDVRAKYLKPLCAKLARDAGREDLERTADVVEQFMMREKQIPPNLDWPTARVYSYLGLPVSLYTPLFVVSRITGWWRTSWNSAPPTG